jgi:hypothetical protein
LVLAPNKNPAVLANKITELSVRLNVTEEQIRLLREENQRLKQIAVAHEKLKGEHQQAVERKVLLEKRKVERAARKAKSRAEKKPKKL